MSDFPPPPPTDPTGTPAPPAGTPHPGQAAGPYQGGTGYPGMPGGQPYPGMPAGAAYPAAPGYPGAPGQAGMPYADFGARVGAYLVDALVALVGMLPALVGVGLAIAGTAEMTPDPVTGEPTLTEAGGATVGIGFVLVVLGSLLALLLNAWNRWWRQGRTGQSIGKKVVGLRLQHQVTGAPIGFGYALLRDLINGIIPVYLGYLWMLWDDNKQTLGDKAATSVVLRVPKA